MSIEPIAALVATVCTAYPADGKIVVVDDRPPDSTRDMMRDETETLVDRVNIP